MTCKYYRDNIFGRRITICILYRKQSIGQIKYTIIQIGVSIQNPKDTPDDDLGTLIAHQRAETLKNASNKSIYFQIVNDGIPFKLTNERGIDFIVEQLRRDIRNNPKKYIASFKIPLQQLKTNNQQSISSVRTVVMADGEREISTNQ